MRRRSLTQVPEHRRFESRRTLACSAKAFLVPYNSLTSNTFYFSTVEDESKPRRRPALRRRTRHRKHRTTRHGRALHSPPARRFDDDPSRRVLPAQQSNRLGRSHSVALLLHPHRPRGGVPLTEIRTRSTPDRSPQADSRRRASVHHRDRVSTRAGDPAPPARERRDCKLDHASPDPGRVASNASPPTSAVATGARCTCAKRPAPKHLSRRSTMPWASAPLPEGSARTSCRRPLTRTCSATRAIQAA